MTGINRLLPLRNRRAAKGSQLSPDASGGWGSEGADRLRQCPPYQAKSRHEARQVVAKVVTHARYVIFGVAEVAIPRGLFATILQRIRRLRPPARVPG